MEDHELGRAFAGEQAKNESDWEEQQQEQEQRRPGPEPPVGENPLMPILRRLDVLQEAIETGLQAIEEHFEERVSRLEYQGEIHGQLVQEALRQIERATGVEIQRPDALDFEGWKKLREQAAREHAEAAQEGAEEGAEASAEPATVEG